MQIGDVRLDPVADGTFVARPTYFGEDVPPQAHPELFDRHQAAFLPIGCFLVRTGDRLVLVDAGLGPESQDLPHGMHLFGGQLLTRVAAGGSALDPHVIAALLAVRHDDPLANLSYREREVLALMAEGFNNPAIARRLVVSERTVEGHVRHMLLKLNLAESDDGHRRVLAVLAYLRQSPTGS